MEWNDNLETRHDASQVLDNGQVMVYTIHDGSLLARAPQDILGRGRFWSVLSCKGTQAGAKEAPSVWKAPIIRTSAEDDGSFCFGEGNRIPAAMN